MMIFIMIFNKFNKLVFTLSLSFFIVPISSAVSAEKKETSRFSLGYGVAMKKNNRVGNTYKHGDKSLIAQSFPFVQLTINRLSIGAGGVAYRFWGHQFAGASVVLNLGGERYEAPGMGGRKRSVLLGAQLKMGSISFQVLGDVAGRSEGFETQLSYGKMLYQLNDQIIRGTIFIEWHDNRYTNYYYGVKPSESNASRSAYRPDNVFTPGVGLLGIFKLTDEMTLTTGVTTKYVVDRLQRSPTVKKEPFEAGGFSALSYGF